MSRVSAIQNISFTSRPKKAETPKKQEIKEQKDSSSKIMSGLQAKAEITAAEIKKKSIEREIKSYDKRATELLAEAQKQVWEVTHIHDNDGVDYLRGNCIEYVFETDDNYTMQEFAGATLIRESEFVDNKLTKVINHINNSIITVKNDMASSYERGVETNHRGLCTKIDEGINLDSNNNISMYAKGYSYTTDGEENQEVSMFFKDGKVVELKKGYHLNPFTMYTDEKTEIRNGKIKSYSKDFERGMNGVTKVDKAYNFINGKLISSLAGYVDDCGYATAEKFVQIDPATKKATVEKDTEIKKDNVPFLQKYYI